MKTEQLLELINELFDVAEYDDADRCIVLHSRRNGILRFERFAQRVREAAPAVEPTVKDSLTVETVPFVQLTAPARIWLQHSDSDIDNADPFPDHGDVSWCADKINNSDVPYIRADLVALDAETRALALDICEHVLSHTHPWAFIDEAKRLKQLLGAE